MGIFRSKEKDKLIKYFKENNISYNETDNKIETEIVFKDKNISLYPYFVINDAEDYFSIVINLKEISGKVTIDLYQKINSFNLISQYFVMKLSENNILYLEYNTVYTDNLKDIFESSIGSLNSLLEYIENI